MNQQNEAEKNISEINKQMLSFVPQIWKDNPEVKSVFFTVYEVMGVGSTELGKNSGVFNLIADLKIAIQFYFGDIGYVKHFIEVNWDDTQRKINYRHGLKPTVLNDSALFILMSILEDETDEPRIIEKHASLAAIFTLRFGENITYKKMTNLILNIKDDEVVFLKMFKNPGFLPTPIINTSNLKSIEKWLLSLAHHPQKDSYMLSLEYYNDAINTMLHHKKFLSYWQAFEILAGRGDKAAHRIKLLLQEIYGIKKQANEDFCWIGKISGIRDKIVHHGYKFTFHPELEKYIQIIYKDLLMYFLGQDEEKEAYPYYQENKQKLLDMLQT